MAKRNSQGQYILIEFWMFDLRHPPTKQHPEGKKLTANEVHVFAMVFGFSKDGAGSFHGIRGNEGAKKYAAVRLRASESSIKDAFKSLEKSGFIKEKNKRPKGSPIGEEWVVTDKAYESTRITPKPEIGFEENSNSEIPGQIPQKTSEISPKPENGFEGSRPENGLGKDENRLSPKPEIGSIRTLDAQVDNQKYSSINKGLNNNLNNSNPIETNTDELNVYTPYIKELMDESLNKNSSFDVVKEAYLSAIMKGYTPEQIMKAYKKSYTPRYRAENPNTTHLAFRLENWLTDSRGLRFDCPLQKTTKRTQVSKITTPKTPEEISGWLFDNDSQYQTTQRELTGLFAKKTKLALSNSDEGLIADTETNISILQQRLKDIRKTYGFEEVTTDA